jgi:cysteinyl-tRNA synthetase
VLEHLGVSVELCMNVTDVDDKIIKKFWQLQEEAEDAGLPRDSVAVADVSRKYEAEFFEDMDALNVLRPTHVTRVTEYMPKIIAFIARIVDNGFGYPAEDGSVYFNVPAFLESHFYAKCKPSAVNDLQLLGEGEGDLATGAGKRSPRDFALWKAAKPGEPAWDSPWGSGRPGWHIECSAMATDVLGECFDLHTGGVDLMFPHHDNELAQSEAALGTQQWVNYFLHAGHLNIEGRKMGKSLKNFTTIRDALQKFSPSVIRMLFLLRKYSSPMDYSAETMADAQDKWDKIRKFFAAVEGHARLAASVASSASGAPIPGAEALRLGLASAAVRSDNCLRDDFDTKGAVDVLLELIDLGNAHLRDATPSVALLEAACSFIRQQLEIFGVQCSADAGSSESALAAADAVTEALVAFRTQLRDLAAGSATVPSAALLAACDALRDDVLPALGVRLSDKGALSVWARDDPIAIQRDIVAEREARDARAAAKAEAAAKKAAEEIAKAEKAKLHPSQLYVGDVRYIQLDANGLPITQADGEPVPKKQIKKLMKELKTQAQLHVKYFPEAADGLAWILNPPRGQ